MSELDSSPATASPLAAIHRPQQAVLCRLIAMLTAVTTFSSYWGYSRTFQASPEVWAKLVRGAGPAPEQYRIGVVKCAAVLQRFAHVPMRYGFTVIDCISLLLTLLLLAFHLRASASWQRATQIERWFCVAAFFGLAQYALVWVTWYQRPETLPTALLCAVLLHLAARRMDAWNALAIVAVSVAFGLVRADAGVALDLGLMLGCMLQNRTRHATDGKKTSTANLDAPVFMVAALLCALVQLWLMRIAYPNATYEGIPVFQLVRNFKYAHRLVPFALFIAPSAWLGVQLARRRFTPTAPQRGVIIGSGIFLAMAFCLGRVEEVRIFLPFALLLVPATVEAALLQLQDSRNATD